MKKNKRGVSLIVLVITIIVIIILATAVILTINNNNPIDKANEATFKSNVKEYTSALELYMQSVLASNTDNTNMAIFDRLPYSGTGSTTGTIKEVLPEMKDDYAAKFKIEKGALLYVGSVQKEVKWLQEIGIAVQMVMIDETTGVLTGVRDFAYIYGTLVIPEKVTSIAPNAFYNNKGIEVVDFSKNNNITEIPASAFEGCSNLKTIVFSEKITKIGNRAFFQCSMLNNVALPYSLTTLGTYVFYYCTSLSNITLPTNPAFTTIPAATFQSTNIVSIIIPDNITTIGQSAFYQCEQMEKITIGKNVKTTSNPFENCSKLKSIEVSSENPYLDSDEGVLYTQNKIGLISCPAGKESIKIHTNTQSIFNSAFAGCTKLSSIEIPYNVSSIVVPQFSTCTNLTSLTVSSSNSNFKALNNVIYSRDGTRLIAAADTESEIILPNSVTTIDSLAFASCTKLQKIDMSQSQVQKIATQTFQKCNNLAIVEFPDTLAKIETQAFVNTKLTNVTLKEGVTTLEYIAFYNNLYLETVTLPASLTTISQPFATSPKLKSIVIDQKNLNFVSEGGVIYNSDKTELVCMPGNKTSFTVPASVHTLKYGCLAYTFGVTSITLPEKLTKIEAYAFSYAAAITELTIPSSIETIEPNSFGSTGSLKKINIKKTIDSIKGAPWGAPYGINAINWIQ